MTVLGQVITVEELAELLAQLRDDRLLDVRQVAEELEVTPDEVRQWVREGILPCEKVAGRFVFRFSDLIDWQIQGHLRLQSPPESAPGVSA
jgi:hypothetical protein